MSNSLKVIISTFFICFLFNQNITAQVGIGTTSPDASSILDISSSNLGVLFPRVALTSSADNTTINNPANGLLLYNTSNLADITPGFYFWNATAWTRVATGTGATSGTGWALNGNNLNSGTGNEFLGVTSYHPLRFRTNNAQVGLLHPGGGITFGLGAQANNTNSLAIGRNANAGNSTEAIAIGLNATASSYRSLAIGNGATASSGNNTIALGVNAAASAQNSSALGSGAIASGQNSTALGNGTNVSGQNAIAIGVGANATNDYTIILGNTTADTNYNGTKIGLGVTNPTVRLDIAGSVKIVDGTEGAGKVLTSDANGKASWQNLNTAYGEIYKSASDPNQNLNQYTPVNFGTPGVVEGIIANNNNFQVIQAGIYRVSYSLTIFRRFGGGGTSEVAFYLTTGYGNGDRLPGSRSFTTIYTGDSGVINMTKMVHLNAYQSVYVFPEPNNNRVSVVSNSAVFNIELIKAD